LASEGEREGHLPPVSSKERKGGKRKGGGLVLPALSKDRLFTQKSLLTAETAATEHKGER
jgi:hypothetical protein